MKYIPSIKEDWLKAGIIGLLAVIYDQAYHIFFNLPHQVFAITQSETFYYIILKFVIVTVISYLVIKKMILPKVLNDKLKRVLFISIVGAAIFGVLLTYMYPYAYNQWIHVAHAFAIFIAAWMII